MNAVMQACKVPYSGEGFEENSWEVYVISPTGDIVVRDFEHSPDFSEIIIPPGLARTPGYKL